MRHEVDCGHPRTGTLGYDQPAGVALPPELAFLPQGLVDRADLAATARQARIENVCAASVLLANGRLAASTYYQALARHLGVVYIDGWPQLAPISDLSTADRWDVIELASASPARWLAAPRDERLRTMLVEHRAERSRSDLAITTPAHLNSIIHYRAQAAIEEAASDALPASCPRLSAKGIFGTKAALVAVLTFAAVAVTSMFVLRAASDALGFLILLGMIFRCIVCAAGLEPPHEPPRLLSDAQLPHYTVLVPLRTEADIVPDLLEALEAIDYPRAKLEVLILIEPEDRSTRNALAAARLPSWLTIVFGPVGGRLRTKPRALNIGLLMARGVLLTVFDAEDRPSPGQLRQAAALFAASPRDLACLQARLAIDNGSKSLLARALMEHPPQPLRLGVSSDEGAQCPIGF